MSTEGRPSLEPDQPSLAEAAIQSRIVLPPTFCSWRSIMGISVVALLSSILAVLGSSGISDLSGFLMFLLYGQLLGFFCGFSVCISRAWVARLSTRDAWLTAWLLVIFAAAVFSYIAAVIGTVQGFGPGSGQLIQFMIKSVIGAGIVSMALLRYLFIRAQWQAEMLAEADARVQALQARIRPHFLFNSLNTIASLIHDNPESAERATEDLAELFRGSMRRADQLIPMEEELELARKYLGMEKRRMGDRLTVDWSVDDIPATTRVLPLSLQPLLENAVGHGIQPRTDGGVIQVYGRMEGDNIVLTIINPIAESSLSRGGHGMALNNIRSRLALAFGGSASLVTSQDEENFYAVLTIPDATNTNN